MKADLVRDVHGRSADSVEMSHTGTVLQKPEEWVVAFRVAGDRPPLFCICAGGGDVFDYGDLAMALPLHQPVYGFGVPPLDAQFPSVQELAAAYVGKVRELQPAGPYHLCGHSFGGVVVYEMAVLLAAAGQDVGLVALIDTLHPAFRRNLTAGQRLRFWSAYVVDRVAKYARNVRRGRVGHIARDVSDFVVHRSKRTLFKIGRLVFGRLGTPVPGPINSSEMILVSAWNRYAATSYSGRIVLLNAADRPPEYGRDPTLGWSHFATGQIDIRVVPGDHYSVMHAPDVGMLAEQIASYIHATEA